MKNYKGYETIEEREIAELNTKGTILRHEKTGARVILMENDEENKVFYIGFRTPPVDSTGSPHIVEHTGQDGLSGGELQRQGFSEPDACVSGCGVLSEYI